MSQIGEVNNNSTNLGEAMIKINKMARIKKYHQHWEFKIKIINTTNVEVKVSNKKKGKI